MHRLIRTLPLLVALYAAAAHADDPGPRMFLFSGFGTLGVAHSSEELADFSSTTFKPDGAGFSHDWSMDVDTLLGAQILVNVTPKLSAVVQAVAEENYNNTYTPHVEWANIKYQFTPDFSARVGRTALPIFMVADSRKIGYANPWVRPPLEVYNLLPVTSNDGVDASYRMTLGVGTNTMQLTAGQSDSKFPGGAGASHGTAKARELITFVDTYEQGFATVRFNVGRGRLTINAFDPLFDAFRQFGPDGIAIAEKYEVDKNLVTFFGMGASYDPGRWFVMGEWSRVSAHTILGRKTAWYATGGYRFGDFTPTITFAQAFANTLSDPGLDVSTLPPFLVGTATGLNAALNSILSTNQEQNTISIGGRWDFMKNTALKLQFDHTDIGAGSAGPLKNTQPGFQPGQDLNVFSATINFVF